MVGRQLFFPLKVAYQTVLEERRTQRKPVFTYSLVCSSIPKLKGSCSTVQGPASSGLLELCRGECWKDLSESERSRRGEIMKFPIFTSNIFCRASSAAKRASCSCLTAC
eukprot:TRINITY_DN259_c0_g1_i2.p1 TRINITY_DN259_c0_g1~~TRINITY_DN259_c0_g1_i2.p1  ORF type:complete len:109 (+),score=6.67 TRINITY_DN259_c0_g1_i2:189-515(+)